MTSRRIKILALITGVSIAAVVGTATIFPAVYSNAKQWLLNHTSNTQSTTGSNGSGNVAHTYSFSATEANGSIYKGELTVGADSTLAQALANLETDGFTNIRTVLIS